MAYSDKRFHKELQKYIQMSEDIRSKKLESDETEEDNKNEVLRIRTLLRNYKSDTELWNFLTKNSNTLGSIVDLSIYRRAIEVGIDPTIQTSTINQEAYNLLRSGKIDLFNSRVKNFGILNLERVDLLLADLKGANLKNANLINAKLASADLTDANLEGANLAWANLAWTNLTNANLTDANIEKANFRETTLIKAKLQGASLIGANLIRANLSNSTIISPVFDKTTKLSNDTIFIGASIKNPDFIDFIGRFTNYVPKRNKE